VTYLAPKYNHHKNYDTDVKQKWREDVWGYWRYLSGLSQIPKDRQYWTLGDRTVKNGQEVGELKAIQSYGLLEDISSFVSVNFDKEKAVPNLPPCGECGQVLLSHYDLDHHYRHGANWYALPGSIEQIVPIASRLGRFKPALVNLDTTNFPKKGYALAGKVGKYCPPGSYMAVNLIYKFMSRHEPLQSVEDFTQTHRLSHAKIHIPGIEYRNGNCCLATIFLEF
jgi:hypothetical protein